MNLFSKTITWLALVGPCVGLTGGQAHAQEVISGKFYRFQVVGRAGLGEVTDTLPTGPSINESGAVAFSGKAGVSLHAVFVGDVGATAPRTIAQQNTFSFLAGVQIANNNHLIAMDGSISVDAEGFRQNYLRDWNATAPGPYTNTLIAGASNPIANDFRQIRFEASLNSAGQVAFTALRVVAPMSYVNALVTGVRPSFNRTDLANPLRPMISENGRVVVRAGALSTDPIRLYDYNLATFTTIADGTMGFTALGQSPGSSENGQVVVFYGILNQNGAAALGTNPGAGIFASLDVGGPSRRIVRIAGRRVEDDFAGPGETKGLSFGDRPLKRVGASGRV